MKIQKECYRFSVVTILGLACLQHWTQIYAAQQILFLFSFNFKNLPVLISHEAISAAWLN